MLTDHPEYLNHEKDTPELLASRIQAYISLLW